MSFTQEIRELTPFPDTQTPYTKSSGSTKKGSESLINLLGTVGGIINACVFLPMIYTSIKKKRPTPLSWITLILILVARTLWLLYAYLDDDNLLLLFSTLSTAQGLVILYTKIAYKKKKL